MKWIVRVVVFGVGCAIGYGLSGYRLKKLEEEQEKLEEDIKQALFTVVNARTEIETIKKEIEKLENKEESL